jgi:hypothetical protein
VTPDPYLDAPNFTFFNWQAVDDEEGGSEEYYQSDNNIGNDCIGLCTSENVFVYKQTSTKSASFVDLGTQSSKNDSGDFMPDFVRKSASFDPKRPTAICKACGHFEFLKKVIVPSSSAQVLQTRFKKRILRQKDRLHCQTWPKLKNGKHLHLLLTLFQRHRLQEQKVNPRKSQR